MCVGHVQKARMCRTCAETGREAVEGCEKGDCKAQEDVKLSS